MSSNGRSAKVSSRQATTPNDAMEPNLTKVARSLVTNDRNPAAVVTVVIVAGAPI